MFEMALEQLNEAKQSANSRLCTHAYGNGTSSLTGDDGTPILGLEAIIDDDNTYAGKDRSTYTWAQAQVSTLAKANFGADSDGNGVTDGIAALETLWLATSAGLDPKGGIATDLAVVEDEPDYTVTNDTDFLRLKHTMDPQRRYTGSQLDVNASISFMGKPVYRDSKCTADRFYFINNRYLQLDACGAKLINMLLSDTKASPYSREQALGGQMQMYSRNPRYLGSLQLTS